MSYGPCEVNPRKGQVSEDLYQCAQKERIHQEQEKIPYCL